MIELTPEMVEAFERAFDFASSEDQVVIHRRANRAGLAAVLAIVERDYRLTCPASAEWDRGVVRCARDPGHEGGHHGLSPNAGVSWP